MVLRMFVRSQMAERLMQLIHEYVVICNSKICMRVPSKLIVAKDLLSNAAHHPFCLVHWAHSIGITIENGNWCLLDILKWDVRGNPILFAKCIVVSILLESVLNAILEEVSQGLGREWLLVPHGGLFAPHLAEMCANLRLVRFPVLANHGTQANQVNIAVDVLVVVVARGAPQNVHLGAWGQQDCTPQIVMEHLVFLVGQSVQERCGSLVVANVDHLVWVANEWLLHLL